MDTNYQNKIIKDNYDQIPWLNDRTIFLTKHGSHCYGLNTDDSDLDIKGVCVPPKEYYFGFLKNFEQAISNSPNDSVIYELKKFIRLAADANPSILEVLFTDEADHIIKTKAGQLLIDNRNDFISKKVKFTFQGYAFSQIKRCELHRRWIISPVNGYPSRKELGLSERPSLPKDQLLAAEELINNKLKEWEVANFNELNGIEDSVKNFIKDSFSKILLETRSCNDDLWVSAARNIGYDDNFILLLQKEKEYHNKKNDYQHYIEWKKNRNPKRAALEEKYGFDTKFMLHVVRLSLMCEEILETGKVIVKRPDRDFLLDIRNGNVKYEDLIDLVDKKNKKIESLYLSSKIQHSPNKIKLDLLCQSIIESMMN